MITECPICDRELGLDEEDHVARCLDKRIAAAVAEEREATLQRVVEYYRRESRYFPLDLQDVIRAQP